MERNAEDGHTGHHHHHADGHIHGAKAISGGGSGRKLLLSLVITGATLVAELVGGLLTGSLALLSDAAHVFLDIFALALSYGAIRLAARAPSGKHSYGFARMKVLAAFINGATLLLISVEIFRESVARFANPHSVLALPMLVVAGIGLVANLLVALVLGGHDHEDLNARSAFLHVVGDALSSVGVILAGIIMLLTGWTWVDPVASMLIGIIILSGSFRVLKEAIHLLNEGAPEDAEGDEVTAALAALPGVKSVHDTHVWALDPSFRVLSAHIVLEDQPLSRTAGLMSDVKRLLRERYKVEHTTIQFECADCEQCSGSADCEEGVTL
ncbi:MAG TPA: cation diffusion facilitator family transporter [bacterium]|nr:cation diffusion facilitator family transporter [bacterium]